jgi:hypothetical protein
MRDIIAHMRYDFECDLFESAMSWDEKDKGLIRYYRASRAALRVLKNVLICAVVGHKMVDDDPGDAEVGPQPNVYCERCLHG